MTVATDDAPAVELFDPPPTHRPFSSGDVLRLIVGVLVLAFGAVVASVAQATVEGIEADLLRAFAELPDAFESFVLSVAQLATSLLPSVSFVVLVVRRRWRVALLLLLGGALGVVLMAAADVVLIDRELADVLDEIRAESGGTGPTYPNSFAIAGTVATVTVAAPWLSRRWKRTMWWGVGVLAVLRLLAIAEPAFDLVAALGVGTIAGSIVLLLFGSPSNEPGPDAMLAAMRDSGFDPAAIERRAPMDGALRYRVVERSGAEHDVTLRTPDERDGDLLARSYRGLRYRASEVDAHFSSLKRRIEHEALVLGLAQRQGVRVRTVEQLGTTRRGSFFLVTEALDHRPITADDLADRAVLDSLWGQLRCLHDGAVAHRRLMLESISLDEERRPWLDGFDGAQTAPGDRELARDVAVLLTETASVVGATEAVDAAVAGMGGDRVALALLMLQPLALPPATRARAKEHDGLLEAIREEVAEATGQSEVELEELERIKPRTLLMIGAATLAFYSLLPQLANLGDTIDAFGDARFEWIAAALLASAATYVFAALSFQGAVADPIPFAANLRAQVAASFAGLVGPAGAGGLALTARFLQRVGVGPGEAGAAVAVDAIGGFTVHIALLVAFVALSGDSGIGGFSLPDSSTVVLVLAVAFAVIGLLTVIGPVRHRVLAPVARTLRSGIGAIGEVFRQPSRVIALFGGSVGISISYVLAMVATVEAFGGGLTFAEIGAGYLAAVAIATLAPTPGGLGALESALIAAFTGFGLADGVAVSSVLTFRLLTFWIPILPGWLALNWMERNGEL